MTEVPESDFLNLEPWFRAVDTLLYVGWCAFGICVITLSVIHAW